MAQQYRPDNQNNFMRSEFPPPPACRSYGNVNESRFQAPFPRPTGPPPPSHAPPFVGFPPPIRPPTNVMPLQGPSAMTLPPLATSFPPPPNIHPHSVPPANIFPHATVPQPPVGIIHQTSFPPPFSITNINTPPPPLAAAPYMVRGPPPVQIPSQNIPPVLNTSQVPVSLCPPPNLHIPPVHTTGLTNVASLPPLHISDTKTGPKCLTGESDVAHTPIEDKKSTDELWVKSWLQVRTLKTTAKPKNGEITVYRGRLLLRDALQTLADLKMATGFLQNSTNVDDEMWQFKLRKAQKFKEKLELLLSHFNSETVLYLKKRLKRIKAKRSRLRRQRLLEQENEELQVQDRQKAHAALDAWRNDIQEQVLNEKRKEELKTEADNILSEVRKKLQEAKKVLDHLDVLERLRSARLESADKKGLKVSSGSTECFEETVKKLRKLMTHQLEVYESEEHALKVMLETEREQEKQDKVQEKLELFNVYRNETLLRLFGSDPDPSSPLYMYWQYYMQGHSDLGTLVQIRHQWDMYLTPQDDPEGSPVPLGWVLPQPPSSNKWKCLLDTESSEQT